MRLAEEVEALDLRSRASSDSVLSTGDGHVQKHQESGLCLPDRSY